LRPPGEQLRKQNEPEEYNRECSLHSASQRTAISVHSRLGSLDMPRRRNLDLEKLRATLDVICPYCGARIVPENQQRVDWDHLQCPNCGERFVPKSGESERVFVRDFERYRGLSRQGDATCAIPAWH
jgi:DNA-directed RNA polymerase subunit RPC12/RpoP